MRHKIYKVDKAGNYTLIGTTEPNKAFTNWHDAINPKGEYIATGLTLAGAFDLIAREATKQE